MSSTVVVVYRTRQIKVKCNPGTLIKEIKANACSVLSIEPDKYDLRHGKTVLSGSTPFRLCNLVSNAKVDLVPATKRGPASPVKVRVQAVDLPAEYSAKLLDEFPSHTTIWNILKKFEKQSGINFTERSYKKKLKKMYELPTVQLFNSVLTKLDQLDDSLYDLGIEDGTVSLRVRFEKSDLPLETALAFHKNFRSPDAAAQAAVAHAASAQENPSSKAVAPQPTPTTTAPLPQVSPTPASHGLVEEKTTAEKAPVEKAEVPAPQPGAVPVPQPAAAPAPAPTGTSDIKIYNSSASATRKIDGEPGEMTLGQFNGYVNQLKNMSDSNTPHLMTKAMREAAENEKIAKITQCTVRFRFPNQDYAEVTFPGSATAADLYDFVKTIILHPNQPFLLFITPPRQELALAQKLVKDLKFGTRQVVFFEWVGASPVAAGSILKPEYRSKAKDITEAPEVASSQSASAPSATSSSSDAKKKIISKPKWMKLSKK